MAGIIAGDSATAARRRPATRAATSGVAPDANLISIKVADENGNATVLDVIYGLQFAVDHKADYNIRVVNLSLESTSAESYKTDPLDAAVEAAWFNGIVVVAAAGNRGTADDAVNYAPGNDPYVISVGAVDDQGTKEIADDALAELVEPRHDPGRLRQAGHLRAGRPHRLEPRARAAQFAVALPELHRRRGEYIRAGGTSMAAPMVAGAVADMLQARPDADAEPGQGAACATGPPADRLDRRVSAWSTPPAASSATAATRQPGPDAQPVHRPGHRRHRLHALELEPLLLERRRRAAAVELEPLELEPGSGDRRELRRRGRRPDALELEPLLLEPLELVDQLDEVTHLPGDRRGRRAQD